MDAEAAHGSLSLLRDGVPLLGFALVFVLIFRRLGLGATLGFLVAGAVVGPQLLGLVDGAEAKMGIAELGIALLLFLVGLELSPSRLWRMRRDIFGLGLLQVSVCGLAVAGIVFSVDKFMSEVRALTNITGNGVATVVVSWREGELDRDKLQANLCQTVDTSNVETTVTSG